MAKLKGIPAPGKKLSLKGGLVTYIRDGQLIAQKGRSKTGRPKSQVTRWQNDYFTIKNNVVKYMDPWAMWVAWKLTQGTQFYPRDILLSVISLRFLGTLTVDGEEVTSMAIIEDISTDLDMLLGETPGTIMYRGTDLWQALQPSTAGYILVTKGAGLAPEWTPPNLTGGLYWTRSKPSGSFVTGAVNTKGMMFVASNTFTITEIAGYIDVVTGQGYSAGIYRLDSSNEQIAILGKTTVYTAPDGLPHWISQPMISPVTINAGWRVAIAWSRPAAGNTYPLPMGGTASIADWAGLPYVPFGIDGDEVNGANIAKAQPQNGDTWNAFAGPAFSLGFKIGITG